MASLILIIAFFRLISACEKAQKPQQALQRRQWQVIQLDSFTPDVITYNAATNACEMQQDHKPDTITCNALISACEKAQDQKRAFQVFERMQRQGLTSNVIACSAVISACEKAQGQTCVFQVFGRRALCQTASLTTR